MENENWELQIGLSIISALIGVLLALATSGKL